MGFSAGAWSQLKNLTADDLITALKRDGWKLDMKGGSMQIFLKDGRRVSVHYHPKKTYGPKMLQGLLDDAGWSEAEMKKLKLIR